MKKALCYLLLCLAWLPWSTLQAQPEPPTATPLASQPWVDHGDYRVHFSTFTSDFLQPNVASALGFSRANDRIIVNVALTRRAADGSYSLGLPAQITGAATNLMQQRKTLTFKKVAETNATYYLAELRFTNEEMMHFSIDLISPAGDSLAVQFSRKLYVND